MNLSIIYNLDSCCRHLNQPLVIPPYATELDNYNNNTRKNLEKYGNLKIISLTVYRTPIMKMLDTVLNFISIVDLSLFIIYRFRLFVDFISLLILDFD